MPKLLLTICLAISILAFAACGDADANVPEITVQGNEFTYQPASVTLKKGQRVRIKFENTGAQSHDLSSEVPASNVTEKNAGAHTHSAPPAKVHVMADGGKTGTLTLTPTESGSFPLWCSIAGHREAGMTGTFTVE
jgi:uncharacterized cupredoxin-like copper-binding protein